MTVDVKLNAMVDRLDYAERIKSERKLEAELKQLKDRLAWICNIIDIDGDVSVHWIHTELEGLLA